VSWARSSPARWLFVFAAASPGAFAQAKPIRAPVPTSALATRACATLQHRVDAAVGDAPLFLRSGFDFNADRDGVWIEGTAQAALAHHVRGDEAAAMKRLSRVAREFAPGGYACATREPRITTGLAGDAYYFRCPHLGATAWIALAATATNPHVAAR
jgi:hypothetical protein